MFGLSSIIPPENAPFRRFPIRHFTSIRNGGGGAGPFLVLVYPGTRKNSDFRIILIGFPIGFPFAKNFSESGERRHPPSISAFQNRFPSHSVSTVLNFKFHASTNR